MEVQGLIVFSLRRINWYYILVLIYLLSFTNIVIFLLATLLSVYSVVLIMSSLQYSAVFN